MCKFCTIRIKIKSWEKEGKPLLYNPVDYNHRHLADILNLKEKESSFKGFSSSTLMYDMDTFPDWLWGPHAYALFRAAELKHSTRREHEQIQGSESP